MKTIISTALLTLFLCTSSSAQDLSFKGLWDRYQKGEQIREQLVSLTRQKGAQSNDVFNAYYLLAVLEISANHPEKSREFLDQADKVQSGKPQVLVRRAEAFLMQRKFKKVKSELARAKKLIRSKKTPIYLRHQLVQARFEGKSNSPKKGIARLVKLGKKFKKNWEIHFSLGHLYESMDKPKDAIENYALAIKFLPKNDPCLGIYAYQRWAALSISSDGSSYGNKKLVTAAVASYEKFLKRAPKNKVPEDMVNNVRKTIGTLRYFLKKK